MIYPMECGPTYTVTNLPGGQMGLLNRREGPLETLECLTVIKVVPEDLRRKIAVVLS